jgi:WD40 repeat protein
MLSTLECNAQEKQQPKFLRDVAPILQTRCGGCHGAKKTEGDYRLHTFTFLRKPGGSDEQPIVAGKPDESELFRRIVETDADLRMPQEDDPLSPSEIAIIKTWIAQGAKFDGANPDASTKSQMPARKHPNAPKSYRVAVPVWAVAFSPAGKELAVSGYHEVTIWNPIDGKLVRRLNNQPERIQHLQYTKTSDSLLIAGGSPGDYGEVSMINAVNGKRTKVFGTFDDLVLDAELSLDETVVAAGSADRSVRAWNVKSGRELWRNQVHSDWVTGIAISPDGKQVASSSRDLTAKIHTVKSGALFTTFNGHQRQFGQHTGRFRVFDVEIARNSPLVFSAGEGSAIRVWETEKARAENGTAGDMEARFAKKGHTRYIEYGNRKRVFKLAARGKSIFSAAADRLVKEHDIASGKHIRDYSGHRDWVFAVDAHPGSKRMASAGFDGEVRIWDTTSGRIVTSFIAAPNLATGQVNTKDSVSK